METVALDPLVQGVTHTHTPQSYLGAWFAQAQPILTPSVRGTGVEEEGVRWDVIRSELRHALREVHHGALARDLHAAKARRSARVKR